MSGKRKAAAAIILIVIIGIAVYAYVHSDYYGDEGPHDITININYPDAGTLSTTSGHVEHGDLFSCSVTPNNNGYTFVGWYEGTTKRSALTTYIFLPKTDTTLTAWFSIDHNASFTITPDISNYPSNITITSDRNVEITERSWKVTNNTTGDELKNITVDGNSESIFSLHIPEASILTITQIITYTDGETVTDSAVKVVDDHIIAKTFEWKYQKDSWYFPLIDKMHINNGSVTWDVQLPQSWYDDALNSTIPRFGTSADEEIKNYVTSDDPIIKGMAYDLQRFTAGMSDIDRVNFVLKFVQQCFPYEYDIDGKGVLDYYKLPAEMLCEGVGDCEDHAFLFASLIGALGYKAVLYNVDCYDENGVLVSRHLATGVAVPGGSGYSTIVNGEEYYYCEATFETGTNRYNYANVGYIPAGYEVVKTFTL